MIQSVESYPTMAEAQRAMGADAIFMAGGTLVMRDVNAGVTAKRLVRCTDPALSDIRLTGDGVTIGAGVTMATITSHRDVAFLGTVARSVGGPQIRNMATVGGNLFAAHPYGDFAVALLALGARVTVGSQTGAARPLADMLRDRSRSPLIVSVTVQRPPSPADFAYLKVSRIKPKGVSVLSMAAYLPRQGGRIRGARVAFGGMGPMPMQATAVERVLDGQSLDAATIARAAQVAAEGFDPPTDGLASAWYRREVVVVHLKRLLERMGRG